LQEIELGGQNVAQKMKKSRKMAKYCENQRRIARQLEIRAKK